MAQVRALLYVRLMRTLVAVFLLVGARVAAAEEAPLRWEGRGGLSYVTSDDFRGGGFSAAVLRPWQFFAAGFQLDAAFLGDSGVVRGFGDRAYRYGFASLLVGGVAQLRAHAGPVIPYVELTLGIAGTVTLVDENTQCDYQNGPAGGVAGGFTVEIGRRMAVGARGSARMMAGGYGCNAAGGPKSFYTFILYSAGATFDLRW